LNSGFSFLFLISFDFKKENVMFVDFHNHTSLCCHAFGEMDEYVKAAINKDIKIFGFAAHSPWMPQGAEKMALSYEEVPLYVSGVKKLQKIYSTGDNPVIDIRLGMEMDFLPDRMDLPDKFTKEYDLDYAIGSVHYIGSWGFDQETQMHLYSKKTVRGVYERYFDLIKQLAKSGKFDIIGHIDLVKKFGHFPENGWDDIQEDVAKIIGECDITVEINTSGLDKPVKEFYPGVDFVKKLKKYNVPVTLGSDAHCPEDVGRYFEKAISMLKEIGYTEIMTFKKRQRIPVSI
jgi:histidinol-phosphatase (PHP family)